MVSSRGMGKRSSTGLNVGGQAACQIVAGRTARRAQRAAAGVQGAGSAPRTMCGVSALEFRPGTPALPHIVGPEPPTARARARRWPSSGRARTTQGGLGQPSLTGSRSSGRGVHRRPGTGPRASGRGQPPGVQGGATAPVVPHGMLRQSPAACRGVQAGRGAGNLNHPHRWGTRACPGGVPGASRVPVDSPILHLSNIAISFVPRCDARRTRPSW
jgi:hypothetical protein